VGKVGPHSNTSPKGKKKFQWRGWGSRVFQSTERSQGGQGGWNEDRKKGGGAENYWEELRSRLKKELLG